MIYTEYYMLKFASHAVSTRKPYITPRSSDSRGDMGLGLIRHVIQILTCNVHYIIYFNHAFDNTCIQIFTIFLSDQSHFLFQVYHILNFFHMYSNCYGCKFWSKKTPIRYRVCDIVIGVRYRVNDIGLGQSLIMHTQNTCILI